jgi:hypothetical protein
LSKHTPGPLRVIMNGAYFSAWAEVVQECTDPETGETWLRELCSTATTHTSSPDGQLIDGPFGTIVEFPDRFALTDDGLELIANAHLWAAAPELLDFAEEVRRTGDTRLASMAIALIAKATGNQS